MGWGGRGGAARGHPRWALTHNGRTPAGCVEFLARPTMAFVRLREAVELDAVLEVPVPVRFLFLLLGPSSANMDYHEIGRSISTLMSDLPGRDSGKQPPCPPSSPSLCSPLLPGLSSRRGLTPRGSLECNPEIPAFPGEEN